jgi:uncharacterized protein
MSDAIKTQVALLVELKSIDDKAYRLQIGLGQIPEEIAKIDSDLKQHDEAFAMARDTLAEVEKKLRSSEQELKSKEDELHKAEGKMMEVKTNAEYMAAMKENENRKVAKGALEERVLTLMDQLEVQRQTLKALEKEHGSEKTRLLSTKKTLEQQKVQLESDLQQVSGQRQGQSAKLEAKLQALYNKLFIDGGSRGAIASALNCQCSACNMQVRPQVFNEIVAFLAIHQCGHCRKILVPGTPSPGQNETLSASV